MLAWTVKAFPAEKAQDGFVVIDRVLAMRAEIFTHGVILPRLGGSCQESRFCGPCRGPQEILPGAGIIWYNNVWKKSFPLALSALGVNFFFYNNVWKKLRRWL